jgi:hypothetical protein
MQNSYTFFVLITLAKPGQLHVVLHWRHLTTASSVQTDLLGGPAPRSRKHVSYGWSTGEQLLGQSSQEDH